MLKNYFSCLKIKTAITGTDTVLKFMMFFYRYPLIEQTSDKAQILLVQVANELQQSSVVEHSLVNGIQFEEGLDASRHLE
jgi:hypothetical protein